MLCRGFARMGEQMFAQKALQLELKSWSGTAPYRPGGNYISIAQQAAVLERFNVLEDGIIRETRAYNSDSRL